MNPYGQISKLKDNLNRMHQVKAVSRLIHKENMKKQLEMRKRLSSLPGGVDSED